jgi:hypothetical protein
MLASSTSVHREISGYIDLSDRLQRDHSFAKYVIISVQPAQANLLPRRNDLSYFDWDSGQCVVNDSASFQVLTDQPDGMVFRYKKDRKLVHAWSQKYNDGKLTLPGQDEDTGANVQRVSVVSTEYLQCVFYDHLVRRKA